MGILVKMTFIYIWSYVCVLRWDISSLTPGHIWEERKEVQGGPVSFGLQVNKLNFKLYTIILL